LFVICESDLPSGLPPLGGLADGDVDEPLDPPVICESDLPSGLPPLGGLADGDVDEPLDPPVVGCGRDLRSAGRRSQRYSGPRPRIDHCHVIDAVMVP